MDDRVIRFRVGVVVVAAVIITMILITLLGAWPGLLKSQYTVHIQFPEAPGVSVDTPVRKSGIRIGRVSRVQLQDDGTVLLTLQIDQRYVLRRNDVCRLSTGSLVTGDAVLEFVRAEGQAPGEPLADGDYLTSGVVASDPFRVLVKMEGQMTSALASIETAGNQVSDLAGNVNSLLGENNERLIRILDRTDSALLSFDKAMTSVNALFGDEQLNQDVRKSLADFQKLLGDGSQTIAEMRETLSGFGRVSQRAERNLANLEAFTQPLGERGEQMADSLSRSVQNIDALLSQLVELTESVNSRKGTIGRLVGDSELYDRLNRAVGNVEDVTRKLQPIVDDVRVFTDKIARDPRILGAKGALDRRPAGAGIKLPLH